MTGKETSSGQLDNEPVPSESPPKEEPGGVVWIHWKDEYWNDKDSDHHQGAAHNTTLLTTTGMQGNISKGPDLVSTNRDLMLSFLPLLVVFGVALLLTLLGNALVCLVYRTRFRRNTANLFVVFLAGLEMVTMTLVVPMEMAMLALPLRFHSDVACKMARYLEMAAVCVVLLTLMAIAVERYCKLTRPANFLPQKWVKGLCVGAVLLALCLALPALVLFGSKRVSHQSWGEETAVTCDVDDTMKSSPVRIIYTVLLLLSFAAPTTTCAVLYTIMFVRIYRRKTASRSEKVSPARREYPRKHRFVTDDSTSSIGNEETRRLPTSSSGSGSSGLGNATSPRSAIHSGGGDPARVPLKSGVKESARIGQGASTTVDVQSTRMTWIFFVVTLTTVVTIVPFVVLRSLQAMSHLLQDHQPLPAHIVQQMFVRFYLLSPPIIPIIYIITNHNFRREAKHLLQKLGLSCKRQPAPSSTQHPPHASNSSHR